MTKIKKDGKYIRRSDMASNGQPVPNAKPVKILTTTLEGEYCVAYQVEGGIKQVTPAGRLLDGERESEFDLFPWPNPPIYIPWESIKEVPLDARFRKKQSPKCSYKESGINIEGDEIKIDGGWFSMPSLNLSCEYSLDNGATWMPCGIPKAVTND